MKLKVQPKWLAIDLGAESGRALLGYFDRHKLRTTEIHRFPNHKLEINGHQHWDFYYLYNEIIKSLQISSVHPKGRPGSMAIDTWERLAPKLYFMKKRLHLMKMDLYRI